MSVTERSAHGIITDLTKAGYVVKHRDGRRNRYQIQAHLPLPEPTTREPAIGEVLAVLLGNTDGLAGPAGLAAGDQGRSPADGAESLPPGQMVTVFPGGLEGDDGRLPNSGNPFGGARE
jgi:hypothetical protein